MKRKPEARSSVPAKGVPSTTRGLEVLISRVDPAYRAALESARQRTRTERLGFLAQRLPLPYARSQLVVPPGVAAQLDLARAFASGWKKVLDDWGFPRHATFGRKLAMLFAGPPGTGKTMAAQVIARQLGFDLYQVDLSRVSSKYIGETEKRLAELIDGLQSAMVLFTGADVLLGNRDSVEGAHGRNVNPVAGYLLQCIEDREGVTVLVTNDMEHIDSAFRRRLQVVVKFPIPSAPDRQRIWKGMVAKHLKRGENIDLAYLAREFELSGGEIRNAAMAAALLAAAEDRSIAMRHLTAAIHLELAKAGRRASAAPSV